MKPRLIALVIALACAPVLADSSARAWAEYEDRVGHAYAYATSPDSSLRYCKKHYPDFGTAIDDRVSEWAKRNQAVLREVSAHWAAMVDRASQDGKMPRSMFYQALAQQNDQMLFDFLKKSEEQSVGYARGYCQAFATTMLSDDRFQLEHALREPLQVLRACGSASYCPRSNAQQ